MISLTCRELLLFRRISRFHTVTTTMIVTRNRSFRCHSTSSSSSIGGSSLSNSSSSSSSSNNPAVVATVYSSLSSDPPMDYARGWAWQQTLLHQRLQERKNESTAAAALANTTDDHDSILLLEHGPVYTLGRGADEGHLVFLNQAEEELSNNNNKNDERRQRLARSSRGPGSARLSMDKQRLMNVSNTTIHTTTTTTSAAAIVDELSQMATPVMAPNGANIYRIDRGGEVTFHGPGQLVVYPLLDLKRLTPDLHWYLRHVEQVIMETLADYDIRGVRDEINTGVWVDQCKVAAIGVSSSRWITTHGFALNVNPPLEYFDTSYIIPCGIEGRGVTSMEAILRARGETAHIPTIHQVANTVLNKLEQVFGIQIVPIRLEIR